MKTALITGIAGQTGSYLADQLVATGWSVHGIARDADRTDRTVLPADVVIHGLDLTETNALADLVSAVNPDAVFNLAAVSSVAESWRDPVRVAAVNGLAVAGLLAAVESTSDAAGKQIAFVQASSAEIFGKAEEVPQTELTRINPQNPYGAAKAFAHHLVAVYRAKGIAASSCILYNHESPRRPEAFVTRKITRGVARIIRGLDDRIVLGNLDAERDWGWAPDYADALARTAAQTVGDDFVIATGQRHSIRQFAQAAFASVGINEWERYVGTSEEFVRPTDAPVLVGDPGKARRELGWAPTVHFEEIVDRMVRNDLDELARGH